MPMFCSNSRRSICRNNGGPNSLSAKTKYCRPGYNELILLHVCFPCLREVPQLPGRKVASDVSNVDPDQCVNISNQLLLIHIGSSPDAGSLG